MDTRQIRRLAYDGNYQRAIEMLCDIIETQDRLIEKLTQTIANIASDLEIHKLIGQMKENPEVVKQILEQLNKEQEQ